MGRFLETLVSAHLAGAPTLDQGGKGLKVPDRYCVIEKDEPPRKRGGSQ